MRTILLFILLIFTGNLFATNPVSVNMNLYKKLQNRSQDNSELFLLVKGDVAKIREFVEQKNGTFIGSAGNIASVRMDLNAIAELLEKNFVKQIGSDVSHMKIMNDTMRMHAHVDEVNSGEIPLLQAYKGNGVVIGMIDSGLDTDHPDFKDSLGNTRVKWLWDMTLANAANTPQPYNYGQEWNGTQIDAGLSSAHTGQAQFGHGTYTTGIAAGNGRAVGRFQGVAPEADLIIVAYDFAAMDMVPRLQHGVEYIFNKAQQLGKPCVINASLGDYYGSHDGLDLQAQYISNLINQQSGRVLVQACGDIGTNWPFHVGHTSTVNDTSFAWMIRDSASGACYFQIFADTQNLSQIHFSIGADKVKPYFESRGEIPYTTIFPSLNNLVSTDLMSGLNRIGNIQMYTSLADSVYLLEIYISPDTADYYWRFTTTGNGHYDSWHFNYNVTYVAPLPTVVQFPDIAHYIAPDTFQTIVSGVNCLDNVISVANYYNTDRHYDVDSILHVDTNYISQAISASSGRGPTRNGMNKPDLAAPGDHIISCGEQNLISGLLGSNRKKVAEGGYHITGGGTSASAPVVAGIAALYLEQNAGAGWQEVKNALTNCSFNDSYMWGPYPNNAWGYGKVNAFESMTTCSNVAVNSVKPILNDFRIYPNPANSTLNVETYRVSSGVAEILDINGRVLSAINFEENRFSVSLSDLSEGIYFLKVRSENNVPRVANFIVTH